MSKNIYSLKENYTKFRNYNDQQEYWSTHTSDEVAQAVTGMRSALRKIYNRMAYNKGVKAQGYSGIDSIEMGMIREHYGENNGYMSDFKIPNINQLKNRHKVRELKEGQEPIYQHSDTYYNKWDRQALKAEFEWLSDRLNSSYFSVKGAYKQLEMTRQILKDKGMDDTSSIGFKEQYDLWHTYQELKDDSFNLGSKDTVKRISEIMTTVEYRDLDDLKSKALKSIKGESMASDVLAHSGRQDKAKYYNDDNFDDDYYN